MNGALWLLPLFAVGYALWAFSACGGWNATNRQTGSLPKTLPAGRDHRQEPLCPRPAPLPATSCRRI